MERLRILTERLFLRSPNVNVCFRIRIAGTIGKDRIEAAVENLRTRHPLLNCAIEIDGDHNAWFVPGTGHITVEQYQADEMPDWQTWYEKTDNAPFDFIQGPLVKICVITSAGETEIIVLGHHIVSDGIGFLILSKDLLLALDGRLETTPQELSQVNKFQSGGGLRLLSKLYARKLNKEWRKNRVHFSEDEYAGFFRQYHDTYPARLYVSSVDEADLNKLLEKCKANGMTMNELLSSAFAAAMISLLDRYSEKEMPVGVVANTRGELATKPYHCLGNYVSGISAKVRYDGEKDFMENARSIAAIMRKKLKDVYDRHLIVNFLSEFDGGLIEAIMYASYGGHELPVPKKIGELIGEGTVNKGMGMSNLGRHEFSGYQTFRFLDIQFIGPAFPANLLSVNIITANNKLNVCLRYNENEMTAQTAKIIYEKALELLGI